MGGAPCENLKFYLFQFEIQRNHRVIYFSDTTFLGIGERDGIREGGKEIISVREKRFRIGKYKAFNLNYIFGINFAHELNQQSLQSPVYFYL